MEAASPRKRGTRRREERLSSLSGSAGFNPCTCSRGNERSSSISGIHGQRRGSILCMGKMSTDTPASTRLRTSRAKNVSPLIGNLFVNNARRRGAFP